MSSLPPRPRTNSTNPRPGSTNFPRMSIRARARADDSSRPPPLRPASTNATTQQTPLRPKPRPGRPATTTTTPAAPPPVTRPTPANPTAARDDSGTKTQINQTLAIAMMTSPINPLPFPLPIPLGVTLLLSPSSGRGRSGSGSGGSGGAR
ncbi:hypothetical protein QBC47DRAFT_40026 [Echria macrotheca]|uniref:Uncharacterized protein n=1 Tax=Echria macrotheca TaxID=438768 RepID=A0AAJ0B9M0_9PEZI|nr:hypothetical protein QBC47DRAFT_40026 [Echria macrotheca]